MAYCRGGRRLAGLAERVQGQTETAVYPPWDPDAATDSVMALANIQVATGETARATGGRLMLAFNTPFFPDKAVEGLVGPLLPG